MKALDLANYIIVTANKDYPMVSLTHLKLQKIIYYIVTSYMQEHPNSTLPFSEKIEKWQFGPVVAEVYNEFKTYGGRAITAPASKIIFDEDALDFEIDEFDERKFTAENEFIIDIADQVINKLINKDAFTLVDMTHKEKAWLDAEVHIQNGAKGLIYSLDELKSATYIL